MNHFAPVTDLRDIDRAVLTAAGMVRDFADTTHGRSLTPTQALTVVAIAAFDLTIAKGVPPRTAAEKLRQIADALERG